MCALYKASSSQMYLLCMSHTYTLTILCKMLLYVVINQVWVDGGANRLETRMQVNTIIISP